MKELRIPSTDPIHGQGLKDEGGPLCRCQTCSVVRSAVFFLRFDGSKYKLFRDCCFKAENL